jgi:hypothetical protein
VLGALRPEAGVTHVSTRRGSAEESGSAAFALDLSSSARLFAAYQGEFGGGTGSNVSVGIELGF